MRGRKREGGRKRKVRILGTKSFLSLRESLGSQGLTGWLTNRLRPRVMGMSLSKLQETVKDREAWHAAVHGVTGHKESDTTWRLINNRTCLERSDQEQPAQMPPEPCRYCKTCVSQVTGEKWRLRRTKSRCTSKGSGTSSALWRPTVLTWKGHLVCSALLIFQEKLDIQILIGNFLIFKTPSKPKKYMRRQSLFHVRAQCSCRDELTWT